MLMILTQSCFLSSVAAIAYCRGWDDPLSKGSSFLCSQFLLLKGSADHFGFFPFSRSRSWKGSGVFHWHQGCGRPGEAGHNDPEPLQEGCAMSGGARGGPGEQHGQVHPSGGGALRCRHDLWWTPRAREPLCRGGLTAAWSHQGQLCVRSRTCCLLSNVTP